MTASPLSTNQLLPLLALPTFRARARRELGEIAIIPLREAGLCPQCEAVSNLERCPVCDSQTVVLGRVLERRRELGSRLASNRTGNRDRRDRRKLASQAVRS
jgi:hypothetical protein